MKNRVTMEMTRNKQKATLYTLQRRNETWNGNIVDDDEHKEKAKNRRSVRERENKFAAQVQCLRRVVATTTVPYGVCVCVDTLSKKKETSLIE